MVCATMPVLRMNPTTQPQSSAAMAHTVLIVEDEPDIAEMLGFTLRRAGLRVDAVESAEQALQALDTGLPDLVLIDWMLPGMSGVELARRLRRDEHTRALPLIMLTARGEESDKLRSFDAGIDDYVTKPFSPRELSARIRALLRRAGAPASAVLEHPPLAVDGDAHELRIDAQPVPVGPTEFRLLEFFMRNPGRTWQRAQLIDHVWGRGVFVEERTVDVHVLRLRRVLKPFGLEGVIETVRGVGYRYRKP